MRASLRSACGVLEPTRPANVIVVNHLGTRVPGALLTVLKQSPAVVVTQGVTTTYQVSAQSIANPDGVALFGGLEFGTYDYALSAADHASASNTLTINPGSSTQTITLALQGLPRLVVAPTTPVVNVLPGQHAAQEITIHNPGAAALTNVTIAVPQSIPWVYLGTPASIPSIGPGESVAFTVFASPPSNVSGDIHQGMIQVSADGGRVAFVALTVQIAPVEPRDIQVLAADSSGQAVRGGGTITLIRQQPTVQVTEGVTTTFNQQFSQPLGNNGLAQFSGLPPGDYNYLVSAQGYEQGAATLVVERRLASAPTQVVTATVRPDPFTYTWSVTPIQQVYDIQPDADL